MELYEVITEIENSDIYGDISYCAFLLSVIGEIDIETTRELITEGYREHDHRHQEFAKRVG